MIRAGDVSAEEGLTPRRLDLAFMVTTREKVSWEISTTQPATSGFR